MKRAVLAVLVTATLGLAACGDEDDETAVTITQTAPTNTAGGATTTPTTPVSPTTPTTPTTTPTTPTTTPTTPAGGATGGNADEQAVRQLIAQFTPLSDAQNQSACQLVTSDFTGPGQQTCQTLVQRGHSFGEVNLEQVIIQGDNAVARGTDREGRVRFLAQRENGRWLLDDVQVLG